MLTMKKLYRALVIATCGILLTVFSPERSFAQNDFEKQVKDYIQKFPYQETFDYVMQLTGGDAGKLNKWVQASRNLLKAGEDKIVRRLDHLHARSQSAQTLRSRQYTRRSR